MSFVKTCDDYLSQRQGKYEYRRFRYRETGAWLKLNDLTDADTIVDVGAGMTEFDYCMRTDFDWRGRYIPIDGCVDGTDLESWAPPRRSEWFVGLEIIEHLHHWRELIIGMQQYSDKGIVLSTPNPCTTDVLGMDDDHKVEIWAYMLEDLGFKVETRNFYGNFEDGLFATWRKND